MNSLYTFIKICEVRLGSTKMSETFSIQLWMKVQKRFRLSERTDVFFTLCEPWFLRFVESDNRESRLQSRQIIKYSLEILKHDLLYFQNTFLTAPPFTIKFQIKENKHRHKERNNQTDRQLVVTKHRLYYENKT